jgi:16S rRNA (guanine527-N7)-methyltransferase
MDYTYSLSLGSMSGVELVKKYFPSVSPAQYQQFEAMQALYADWNNKVNLVSRKDMDNLYEHHVLHSLAIARFIQFNKGSSIVDIGTGGGFPGIPLAILFPHVKFTLVDSIGKKIRAVEDIAFSLRLTNVIALQTRAEQVKGPFDFAVSRATAPLDKLMYWISASISKVNQHSIPNGIICLKGGDLDEELSVYKDKVQIKEIKDYFRESFFETKKLVYLPGMSSMHTVDR